MADPYGIVGVVGVAMQIVQVFVQFGLDWRDAPQEARSFLAEIQTFKIVLSELNMNLSLNPVFADAFQHHPSLILSQLGANTPSNTDTKVMLRRCQSQLQSLLKDLEKRGKGHRVGWERFKGAFLAQETRESVENLQRQCQLLNSMVLIDTAVLGAQTHKAVQEARKEQDQSRRTQQDWRRAEMTKEILKWLTPIHSGSQQSDFLRRHQEGTGRWLLDSNEFRRWENGDGQTLFCPGIPGAGKTIMTSAIVDHLCAKYQNDDRRGVAYLFFEFGRQHEQTPVNLLASLLKQLIPGLTLMPESVTSLYNRHKDKETRPSVAEMSAVLRVIIEEYSRTFLVIDALDECQASGGARQQFLSEIFDLQVKTKTNLFVTSRRIPEITKYFGGSIMVEIRASPDDVRKYIDGQMSRLPAFVSRNVDLQNEITTEIVNAVDGMFLLAYFHLESLMEKKSPKALRETLRTLPRGSEALDHAYKDAMERIQYQARDSKDLAQQTLSWILYAERPLTTKELQVAVSVETGGSQFDEENLHDIEDMISVCAGLVTLDEESDMIRLVHYTTQEYFDRTRETWFPDAQRVIAKTCVTYLSYRTFDTGRCQTIESFNTRLQQNPLYDYAANHWGHHTRISETEGDCLVLDFLESTANVSGTCQALKGFWYGTGEEEKDEEGISGLHLAACFGLENAMTALLKKGHDPDSIDGIGRTPLSWAAEHGHELIIQLLLENGADLGSMDSYGETPIFPAARHGKVGAVRMLLTQNDLEGNQKDDDGNTALSTAVKDGHEDVVNLFLLEMLKPLLHSIGHEDAAKLPFTKDESAASCSNGDTICDALEVLSNLIERRPQEDLLKIMRFETFLWCAAAFGNATIVRLLLTLNGIDVNSKGPNQQSALSLAVENGHEAVVRLLLAVDGIDVNSQDLGGMSALSWAAVSGHEAVVRLLLAVDGIDVNSQDLGGMSALSLAAVSGHEAVVRLLLAVDGIDVDSQDSSGMSALSWAAVSGREAVVRLLLAVDGIDVDSRDQDGCSALFRAANRDYKAMVGLLLKAGANVNAEDREGWTPLTHAANTGRVGTAELLIEKGANVNARDGNGHTALWHAEQEGHDEIAELLREHGAISERRQHDSSETFLVASIGEDIQ